MALQAARIALAFGLLCVAAAAVAAGVNQLAGLGEWFAELAGLFNPHRPETESLRDGLKLVLGGVLTTLPAGLLLASPGRSRHSPVPGGRDRTEVLKDWKIR